MNKQTNTRKILTRHHTKSHGKFAILASDRSVGDNVTLGLAVTAAVVSSMFAGFMWTSNPDERAEGRLIFQTIALQADDEGRTDVRPIGPTVGPQRVAAHVDPITTATVPIDPGGSKESNSPAASIQSANAARRLNQFVLLGIYADTALVAENVPGAQRLWPVKIGSLVPGAGRVIALIANDVNPSVLTTTGVISIEGAAP